MYLFKISLQPIDVWSPFYAKSLKGKLKPIYVVADTKDAAISYANSYIRSGLTVKSVSRLAKQLGTNMFSGNSP